MDDICEDLNKCICRISFRYNEETVPLGTGFFINNEGIIITCNHVISVQRPDENGLIRHHYLDNILVEKDELTYEATIINDTESLDPIIMDYAILEIEGGGFPPLPISTFDSVTIGRDIIFGGHPFGSSDFHVTRGTVSSKYTRPSDFNQLVNINTIALNAAVNRGNSGGPLYDIESKGIVGIITTKRGSLKEQIRRMIDVKIQNDLIQFQDEVIKTFRITNIFLNPGIGEAHSIEYVVSELTDMGVI